MISTLEEVLHQLEAKAALLRYCATLASANLEHPDPAVLRGFGEIASDLEERSRHFRGQLPARILCADVALNLDDSDE